MKQPLVTVITVCYNPGEMLQKTIGCVASQTYGAIEYIIVDGGSTDGTARWLASSAPPRIDRWISEKDGGIYDAMNKGSQMATGDWIIFMNAGDTFYSPHTLADIFDNINCQSAGVIYGDVAKLDKNGNPFIKKAEPVHNSHRMFFCHQSALVRRELLLSHPFDTSHRLSADFKFFKTLIRGNVPFVKLDIPVAFFDTTGISNTRRSTGLRDNIEVIREVDTAAGKLKLLPRLYLTYLLCRLRGR